MPDFVYTQIPKEEQLQQIQDRRKRIEEQHLAVTLRAKAPDLGAGDAETDTALQKELEASLAALKQMEDNLDAPKLAT